MTTSRRLETESGAVRRLLTLAVGFVIALLGLALTTVPATAQNVVGPQPVQTILTVGPHGTAGQENVGVRGPPQLQQASATGVAPNPGQTLFRGTSEGYEGGAGSLRSGVVPASTDPRVAAAFATHSEQFGTGVMHIASPGDLAGLKVELGAGYLPYESEAFVHTSAADFAARSGLSISSGDARAVLGEMGLPVPGQIATPGDLTSFLRGNGPMSAGQISEFLSRIG